MVRRREVSAKRFSEDSALIELCAGRRLTLAKVLAGELGCQGVEVPVNMDLERSLHCPHRE